MTIKGSFILEHPYIKSIFGCKKTSNQNRPPKLRVFRNLCI